jgi:FkbM family methyltransferase
VNDKLVWFKPFGEESFAITGDDGDIGVIGEVDRSGGRYQRELSVFSRRTLAQDAVVVDGGAHIGVVSILLASLCPAGRVYAFEPAEASRRHLVANLAANDITNVTVESSVLYDTDDDVVFDFDSVYPAGSHVGASGPGVAAVRLDTWAHERGIERLDLLKLDVEGSEIAVLAGAAETIRRFRPTAIVECNPVALRRFGDCSYRDLVGVMRSLFPTLAVLSPAGAVIPLLSDTHLDLLLADQGVVDLVGLTPRGPMQTALGWGRSVRDVAHLSRVYNRRRPAENKIVEPVAGLTSGVSEISAVAGACITVPTTIVNKTRWWWSSAFPYHPVHVAYRVLDAAGATVIANGHRTSLPAPLGPGRSVTVDMTVELPAVSGSYQLATTLVQEAFAWFDELNPECTLLTPMRVA